jgi:hypothetical protein
MYKNKFTDLFLKKTDTKIISNNKNLDIIIIIIIIIILILVAVITYNNTIEKRLQQFNNKQLQELPTKLKPIEDCNKRRNYRLVDYYIASSYNTASLGNKHYDYVSTDAIRNTLLQGARYIQLNIFSLNVNINDVNDEPLIGTSTGNDNHITSLNTIQFKDVLETIVSYAFKVKAEKGFKNINYPLIIDLTINTKNINVLDKAADYIIEILGDYLLPREKYVSFPIQFEYLCNLLDKIIIWVNGSELEETKLKNIVIPKNLLIQKLFIAQITNSILTPSELEQYLKSISKITIREIYKQSDIFSKVIDNIKNNPKSIYDLNAVRDTISIKYNEEGIINKLDLENKFIFFNSIGMTIIEPNPNQIFIENFDFRLPFNTGCQIIAMAYQKTDDKQLKIYKKLFSESSFILKPSNIRIPDTDQLESIDLLEKYDIVKQITNPINYYIPYYNYNYALIYLQEIVSSEYKYAYITDNKTFEFKDKTLVNENYLLIKKTKIDGVDAFYILDPLNQNFALTIKNNYNSNLKDNLEFSLINPKKKQYQTFIIEKSLKDDFQYSIGEQVGISVRSVLNTDYPFYLTTYKNKIVLRKLETVKPEMMTFNSELKTAKFVSKLTNLLSGPVKVYENGFVGIGTKHSNIEFIYDKVNESNNLTSIYMKYNGKYLCMLDNKLKLSGDTKCSLTIEVDSTGNNYFIKKNNKYLIANKSGILEFKEDQPIIQEEEKDPITGKILKHKRVGPKLGSEKYYSIISKINF